MSEIIRKAKTDDFERIAEIWQSSFGDEKEYTDFFLKKRIQSAKTLVFEKDGTVASQLFLLPVTAGTLDGYYLYAAATDENYRGKGMMARLLYEAEKEAVGDGKDFIMLVPGTESLFGYYGKFGYEASFFKYTGTLEKAKNPQHDTDFSLKAEDAVGFLNSFRNCIRWDEEALSYATDEFLSFRGKLVTLKDKAVIMMSEDEAVVLCEEENLPSALKTLEALSENSNIPVISTVPFGKKTFGGMVLKLTDEAKSFCFDSMFVIFAKE